MADQQTPPDFDESPAPPGPPPATATVVITTSGASVTVTAPEPAAQVLALAQEAHREAHTRCVAAPAGMAGGTGSHL